MTKNILDDFSTGSIDEFYEILNGLCYFDFDTTNAQHEIGLFNGYAGYSLLLNYLYQINEDDEIGLRAQRYLKKAYDNLSPNNFNLSHGNSGVMWLLQYLKSKDLIEDEYESLFQGYDELIRKRIINNTENLDPMHGLLGIANYLFFRNSDVARNCLELILDRARIEMVEYDDDNAYWEMKSTDLMEGTITHINFGYAHGLLAILFYISKFIRSGINPTIAKDLFHKGINYFLSFQDENKQMQFPNRIQEGTIKEATRIAYCYGDLGISCGLAAIADNLYDESLTIKARKLAVNTALIALKDSEQVNDIGLCHGAAGNGYMFLKQYRRFGDPELRAAAVCQYKRLLSLRSDRNDGIIGFRSIDYDHTKKAFYKKTDPGFITGTAGVGLSVLSLLYENFETSWDSILLLQ